MVTTHSLGYPRIGKHRELKFALETYWKGNLSADELERTAADLRRQHWLDQSHLDWVPAGDFSLYDQVLDMSATLGNLPARVLSSDRGPDLDAYFRAARGRSQACCGGGVTAGEMTKWFDTNYHYIVPELDQTTRFTLNPERLLAQFQEARQQGHNAKPVILGPVTYLWLAKSTDGSPKLDALSGLLTVYGQLLEQLAEAGADWIQVDEPALVTELDADWRHAFELAYHQLKGCRPKLLVTTYFGQLRENLQLACELPVAGLHLDAVSARPEVERLIDWLPAHKVLSLGVINGRNVWATDLNPLLDWLEPLYARLRDRLWLAPSCSLLHVPVDLELEAALDPTLVQWLAFARQKLAELSLLATALTDGRERISGALSANRDALSSRRASPLTRRDDVRAALGRVTPQLGSRQAPYAERALLQARRLNLPPYPTTTIGSFPQTSDIRQARRAFRQGELDESGYHHRIRQEIARCVEEQEALGLDVLVHGEAERNDMVEYFGERLDGFAFTQFGWVQSYGSRCVKPPILYGDVRRPNPMTIDWFCYAQSLTSRPVKGMLTGPVTLLNWSFVRDDQPRSETCWQLALAVREEVQDLERAGAAVIQIDEAALREGLPLRRSDWPEYLDWAIDAFRLAANGVDNQTQIHTHMCYSEFNDILDAIARMDADVITIENARSHNALLEAFREVDYPNDLGPGVYDIHSPNVPAAAQIADLLRQAAQRLPAQKLWVNPDCGLKTRRWEEVRPALAAMVAAAAELREGVEAVAQ